MYMIFKLYIYIMTGMETRNTLLTFSDEELYPHPDPIPVAENIPSSNFVRTEPHWV